jgi:excisionase family DNA binding protein
MKEPATVKVEEAARILGIGRQTAYELAAQGKLPGALRLGRRIVVSRSVLEDFLAGKLQGQAQNGSDNSMLHNEHGSARGRGPSEGRVIDITVPLVPDMRLSKNGRVRLHWAVRARLTRDVHEEWYWELLSAIADQTPWGDVRRSSMFNGNVDTFPFGQAELSWEVHFPDGRHRDDDGVRSALAPIRDIFQVGRNLQDAWRLGLIVDDSPTHLVDKGLAIFQRAKEPMTRIVLREVDR